MQRPAGVVVLALWTFFVAADGAVHIFQHLTAPGGGVSASLASSAGAGEIGQHLFILTVWAACGIGLLYMKYWAWRVTIALNVFTLLGLVKSYNDATAHPGEHAAAAFLVAIGICLISIVYLVIPSVRQAFVKKGVAPASPS